ncbi:MAG: hypothetical protein KDD56_05140 [Bdellovibrionales bacterium]|nr:hypothetical protein [Bdellovibrionales bacterium]
MKKRFLAFLLILILSGCHNVSMTSGQPGNGHVVETRKHMFAFGLAGGDSEINLSQVCPGGVAKIDDQITFYDAALSIASVGIYTPRTVSVECVTSLTSDKG